MTQLQASFLVKEDLSIQQRRKWRIPCTWPWSEIAVPVRCCPDEFGNIFRKFQNSFRRYFAATKEHFHLAIRQEFGFWTNYRMAELQRLKCGELHFSYVLRTLHISCWRCGARSRGRSVLDQQIYIMVLFNKTGEPKRFRSHPANGSLVRLPELPARSFPVPINLLSKPIHTYEKFPTVSS